MRTPSELPGSPPPTAKPAMSSPAPVPTGARHETLISLPGSLVATTAKLAGLVVTEPAEGASSATQTHSEPPASRQALKQAIDALPEVFRTVFVLRAIEGISGIETAACLGVHETTVRTRLYRAQRRLSAAMVQRVRSVPG